MTLLRFKLGGVPVAVEDSLLIWPILLWLCAQTSTCDWSREHSKLQRRLNAQEHELEYLHGELHKVQHELWELKR